MELRRVAPQELDLSLGRLRQLPEAAIRAKEASLRSKGQLSPVVAAHNEGVLVLIDGFVRHMAAVRLGLDQVLVEVVHLSAVQMKAQVYLRNRERGLVLIEECRLVRELCEVDHLSQVEVADLLERHKSWVNRRLSLCRQVSEHLLEDLALGLLGPGSLRKLAQLPARNQEELWAVAGKHGLSGRDVGQLVDLWRKAPDPESRRYVLDQPVEALRRARSDPEPSQDPRLGRAGQEVLTGLRAMRQVSLRLLRRLKDGVGELCPEGGELLAEASRMARKDCDKAFTQVAALVARTGGGDR